VVAYLMISTLRYRSFKDLDIKSKKSVVLVPVFGIILAALAWKPEISFTFLALLFAGSAPVTKLLSLVGLFRPKKTEALAALK